MARASTSAAASRSRSSTPASWSARSCGHTSPSTWTSPAPPAPAAERSVAAGIVVVASAGNNGKHPVTGQPILGAINSPGNAPGVITVGALNTFGTAKRSDDAVATYSSRGPTYGDGFVKPD